MPTAPHGLAQYYPKASVSRYKEARTGVLVPIGVTAFKDQ
jgi:hypothetical protein